MTQLVTIVRPHLCIRNAMEVGSAECQWGCKVFQCTVCHTKAVIHNPTYGCRKTK